MQNIDQLIKDYCELNNLKYREFKDKCVEIGFNVIRFGNSPIEKYKMENNIDYEKKNEFGTTVQVEEEPKPKRGKRKKEEKIEPVEENNVEVKKEKTKPKTKVRILKK